MARNTPFHTSIYSMVMKKFFATQVIIIVLIIRARLIFPMRRMRSLRAS